MFLTHSMKCIWYSPQKSKYPIYSKIIIMIIIIIIISIFIEDNVFSTTASLPYGPLVNTDIIFGPFLLLIGHFHIRHAMLVMQYFVLGEDKPVLAL